jgi:monoamine oxidase
MDIDSKTGSETSGQASQPTQTNQPPAKLATPAPLPVVVIGGGLSGLYASYLLHRAGVPFLLLESRGRLGGRIVSTKLDADKKQRQGPALETDAKSNAEKEPLAAGLAALERFDLGPTWFWPGHDRVASLVKALKLRAFPQAQTFINSAGRRSTGDHMVDLGPGGGARRLKK